MNWNNLLNNKRLNSSSASLGFDPQRSDFDRDYDRIVFSYPFRRLQDKTQVVPLPEHDFVHTRLTHSLEVSVVGRTLGKACGNYVIQKYPDLKLSGYTPSDFASITASACLAHDIGNPPFGHSGEEAISELFHTRDFIHNYGHFLTDSELKDLQSFEGNAQGLRILTHNLEGLKLTFATLGAFIKYPRESVISNPDKTKKSQKKYGFFQSEKAIVKNIANELQLIPNHQEVNELCFKRHPLVFLVEAADDICYSIIDLEDACRMGVISESDYTELIAPIIGDKLDRSKLSLTADKNERLGVIRAMAISRLIKESEEVFCHNEHAILEGNFDKAITDCIPSKIALSEISKHSVMNIYNARNVLEVQAAGFEILSGLMQIFTDAVCEYHVMNGKISARNKNLVMLLPNYHKFTEQSDLNFYEKLRMIIDYVSGLTDQHALDLYKKLKGISLL